jgi:N,N'-diacetyllegionaminate synthase
MYYIIETANTHGGDIDYLLELIKQFEKLEAKAGIKFQAFSPDGIATPDFEWYPVYKELYFQPEQWRNIITEARRTKDVWLDLFDIYGVRILEENLAEVHGLKFQSSVLDNREIIARLSGIDLGEKILIINIAAQPEDAIAGKLARIESRLKPKEIWLEIGFQSYPTALTDSGLNKIEQLQQRFGKKVVFADHTDGKSANALYLPLVATTKGVRVIEKHVMLDRETKYDHFSSITFERFREMTEKIAEYQTAFDAPFINDREREYLAKTIMTPILGGDKKAGQTIGAEDFVYRRSGKKGLNTAEVMQKLTQHHLLRKDVKAGEPLQREDLKASTTAVIIACRLKSSRLPEKALKKIGDLSSVQTCIASALKFAGVQHVILATSTVEQDAGLANETYDPSVIFHRGDPDDVISRYLGIAKQLKVDTIVRITADMPYVDAEICSILLDAHFSSGADYTTGKRAAVGTNLEIISTEALQRVKDHFPDASYSEYMTWYFQNNADYFRLNFVELPERLVRDYRLTLDYPEDLEMFNRIAEHFAAAGKKDYTLTDIFTLLDENPEIAAINADCSLVYKTDEKLIALLNEKTRIR